MRAQLELRKHDILQRTPELQVAVRDSTTASNRNSSCMQAAGVIIDRLDNFRSCRPACAISRYY